MWQNHNKSGLWRQLTPKGHLERVNVDKSAGKQGGKEAEVSCEAIYSVSALRKIEGCIPQVQNLPHLLQIVGKRRKNTRHEKSELVRQ